jgi:hypothetical protein
MELHAPPRTRHARAVWPHLMREGAASSDPLTRPSRLLHRVNLVAVHFPVGGAGTTPVSVTPWFGTLLAPTSARLPGRACHTRSSGRLISRPALLDCLPGPRRNHHGSKNRGGASPADTKPSPSDCACRRARYRTKSHTRNTYGPQNPASAHSRAVRPARASMNDGKNDNVIAASATKSTPMCAAIRGRLPVPSQTRLPDPAERNQNTPIKVAG